MVIRNGATMNGMFARVGSWTGLIVLMGLVALTAGCVIEKSVPDIAEDDPEDIMEPDVDPEAPSYARRPRVVRTFPPDKAKNVPRNTPMWVEFDDYLDETRLRNATPLRLTSGGVRASLAFQYSLVSKRILVRLRRPLEELLGYRLFLDLNVVKGLDGAPADIGSPLSFTTGSAATDGTKEAERPTWADIEPILNRGCGCHTLTPPWPDPWFDIPRFTYEGMIREPSRVATDKVLIEPFIPAQSYLLQKALPDYPGVRGARMPPLWSAHNERTANLSARALTYEELSLIELWIFDGAPKD